MNVVTDFGANVTMDDGLVLQTLDTWKTFIRTDKAVLPNNAGELYFEEADMDAFCDHLNKFDICYVHPLLDCEDEVFVHFDHMVSLHDTICQIVV